MPVILINTTYHNIWVRQPLLATELFEVEMEPQQYCTDIIIEADEMTNLFLPAPPCEEQKCVESKAVDGEEKPDPHQKNTLLGDYPEFGERPDSGKAYDFKEK